jgi:hypothetical protein
MQCEWSTWEDCANKEECEQAGECDDWEFEIWNGGEVQSGACVVPPTMDEYGFTDCKWDNGEQWSRVGCIKTDITKKSECTTGKWHRKGVDQRSCMSHGKMCAEEDMWDLTPKNKSHCKKCGGRMKPVYHWNAGIWSQNEFLPLHWKPRKWSSVNRWASTLDHFKINTLMDELIGFKLGQMFANNFRKAYMPITKAMAGIACACTDAAKADGNPCKDYFGGTSELASAQAVSGTSSGIVAQGMKIQLPDDAVSKEADVSEIIMTATGVGAIKAKENEKASDTAESNRMLAMGRNRVRRSIVFKPRQLAANGQEKNAHEYAIVRNSGSYVVGQTVGNAIGIKSAKPLANFTLCVKPSFNIYQDTDLYPMKDFVMLTGEGTLGQPLEVSVTENEKQEWCFSTKNEGQYTPILRLANFKSATKHQCPSTTPTGVTNGCFAIGNGQEPTLLPKGDRIVKASVSLMGLTAASFSADAQIVFRSVIASKSMVSTDQVTITKIADVSRRRQLLVTGRILATSGITVDFEVAGVTKDGAETVTTTLEKFMSDSSGAGLAGVLTTAGVPVSISKQVGEITGTYIPWFSPGSTSFWVGLGGIVLIIVMVVFFFSGGYATWKFRTQIKQMLNKSFFENADANRDGVLDALEIQAVMKSQFNKEMSVAEIEALLKKYDEDGDATTLTWQEWQGMLQKWKDAGIVDGMNIIPSNKVAPAPSTETI